MEMRIKQLGSIVMMFVTKTHHAAAFISEISVQLFLFKNC